MVQAPWLVWHRDFQSRTSDETGWRCGKKFGASERHCQSTGFVSSKCHSPKGSAALSTSSSRHSSYFTGRSRTCTPRRVKNGGTLPSRLSDAIYDFSDSLTDAGSLLEAVACRTAGISIRPEYLRTRARTSYTPNLRRRQQEHPLAAPSSIASKLYLTSNVTPSIRLESISTGSTSMRLEIISSSRSLQLMQSGSEDRRGRCCDCSAYTGSGYAMDMSSRQQKGGGRDVRAEFGRDVVEMLFQPIRASSSKMASLGVAH